MSSGQEFVWRVGQTHSHATHAHKPIVLNGRSLLGYVYTVYIRSSIWDLLPMCPRILRAKLGNQHVQESLLLSICMSAAACNKLCIMFPERYQTNSKEYINILPKFIHTIVCLNMVAKMERHNSYSRNERRVKNQNWSTATGTSVCKECCNISDSWKFHER